MAKEIDQVRAEVQAMAEMISNSFFDYSHGYPNKTNEQAAIPYAQHLAVTLDGKLTTEEITELITESLIVRDKANLLIHIYQHVAPKRE